MKISVFHLKMSFLRFLESLPEAPSRYSEETKRTFRCGPRSCHHRASSRWDQSSSVDSARPGSFGFSKKRRLSQLSGRSCHFERVGV